MATADFPTYGENNGGATAASIREAVSEPTTHTQTLETLVNDLASDAQGARSQIEGDVADIAAANPEAAGQTAQNLARNGYFAVGLINRFADAVETYDQEVEALNATLHTNTSQKYQQLRRMGEDPVYAEVKADEKAKLQGQFSQLVSTLDTAEDTAVTGFQGGAPSAEEAKALMLAGYLPMGAAGLWPNLSLTPDERRQGYEEAVRNGTMPDFSQMPPEEVDEYLADHPEISQDITALMALPTLSPALTSLVEAQSRADARVLNDAMEGDPDAETLEQVEAATERLGVINAAIADGHLMTAAQGNYIESWVNTVGADNLAALPGVVRDAVQTSTPGHLLPPQIDELVRERLAPVGESILNYSNPAVHRDDAGVDQAGYQGSTFTPADGRITLAEMPTAIQELTEMRLGYDNGPDGRLGIAPDESTRQGGRGGSYTYETIDQDQFSSVLNYDKYSGYAELLSSAGDHVEGGADFSQALGEQAIQARQDLNAIAETASETTIGYEGNAHGRGPGNPVHAHLTLNAHDGPMSEMLGVTARSEDGSSQLLLDEDSRQSLLALDWTDDTGATDVITAGTDRQPEGGGDPVLQARAAEAILSDVGAEPEQWADRMNEGMEDAVLDTGLRWVDTFGISGDTGAGVDENGRDVLGREIGPTISLPDDVKEHFLQFAAGTGDEQAARFQGGLTHYGNTLITEALSSDSGSGNAQSDRLKSALAWSGLAEGRMGAANIQWAMNEMGGEHDEAVAQAIAENRQIAANKTAATFVASIAGSASSAIPGAGPFISAGVGALSGPIIDEIFQENPVPDYDSYEDNERLAAIDQAREDGAYSRDYRFASLVAAQYADAPEYANLFTADGRLRPLDDLSGSEKDQLGNLGDNLYEDFNEGHPGQSPVTRAETYDEAYSNAIDDAGVNQNEADPDETDEEREEREESEAAAEDQRRRELLYGANQRDWDEWNRDNPPTGYRRAPQPRESPYDTVPGANP